MAILEEEVWTKQDLLDLAKKQKQVRLMILLVAATFLAAVLLPAALEPLVRTTMIILTIAVIYFAYRLVVAVLPPSATSLILVYVVLSSIPLINLFALLYLDGQATRRLRASGIRVGLQGASAADLDALKDDFTYRYSPPLS